MVVLEALAILRRSTGIRDEDCGANQCARAPLGRSACSCSIAAMIRRQVALPSTSPAASISSARLAACSPPSLPLHFNIEAAERKMSISGSMGRGWYGLAESARLT